MFGIEIARDDTGEAGASGQVNRRDRPRPTRRGRPGRRYDPAGETERARPRAARRAQRLTPAKCSAISANARVRTGLQKERPNEEGEGFQIVVTGPPHLVGLGRCGITPSPGLHGGRAAEVDSSAVPVLDAQPRTRVRRPR